VVSSIICTVNAFDVTQLLSIDMQRVSSKNKIKAMLVAYNIKLLFSFHCAMHEREIERERIVTCPINHSYKNI